MLFLIAQCHHTAHHKRMQNQPLVPDDIAKRYDVREWRNGLAILAAARPAEWTDIRNVLSDFTLLRTDILKPGGSKSDIAGKIDGHFSRLGWKEKQFDTRIVVDDNEFHAPTHKVDCYKNRVALEVEWNNKDPFFDRDLNNFRLLFDLRAIDVGVIITRATGLQAIFNTLGRGASYGNSTTHLDKLLPRIEGGGGGGCPLVAIAIKTEAYKDDGPAQQDDHRSSLVVEGQEVSHDTSRPSMAVHQQDG